MNQEILYGPSYSLARVRLEAGEEINAESGAMVSMSSGIEMQTSAKGGLLSGLKRSLLGGESFFINTFVAAAAGEVTFAPPLPGDIMHMELSDRAMMVQSTSYLASSPGLTVDTKWAGAKGFFAKEGLFLLKVSGRGHLFVSSYGAIHEVPLAAGESYTLDNGHMVAFDESVSYNVRRVGGMKSTLFSGEGYRFHVTGLMHDINGYPTERQDETEELMTRLFNKVSKDFHLLQWYDSYYEEGAEVMVIAYGSVARSALRAVRMAREKGLPVGLLKLQVIWPFMRRTVMKYLSTSRRVIVPEMNMGQLSREVKRVNEGTCEVRTLNRVDGRLITPDQILTSIEEALE